MKTVLTTFAAAAISLTALTADAANVLVVLSDAHSLELKDGKRFATGFYLNELMQPVKLLRDAGHQLTFATPLGKTPAVDKNSVDAMYFGGDRQALAVHSKLLDELRITDASASAVVSLDEIERRGYGRYDAVYIPGGHAPMQDLLTSPKLGKLLRAFHAAAKPTALVCHGPIALMAAMDDAPGYARKLAGQQTVAVPNWIYKGYQVTVFSNVEEEASKAQLNGGQMKFYPQSALEQAGLRFSAAAMWQPHMVVDRELITGQNPASAPLVGEELKRRLATIK
ncbi:MAG: type 1 glutamine amidotransferase domain-containing protein [Pseudomonadota bacterium]